MHSRLLYVLACIVIPLAWGLMVVWVSNRIDGWSRRGRQSPGNVVHPDDALHVDYHI